MQLITLKTFDNAMEAYILKTKLESEGIFCYLFDENIVHLNPIYNIGVGGIKIKVQKQDLNKAESIVQAVANNKEYVNEEIVHCPQCGAEDIIFNYKSMKGIKGFLSAIFSFWFMLYPIYYKNVCKCRSCGIEFKLDETNDESNLSI